MTDMQMLDDAGAMLPATNDIDIFEDWKLLGDYSLDNAFIPTFLAITTVLFGVAGVVAWCIDKQVEISVDALEERMYLLGGDVTADMHQEAEVKSNPDLEQRCYRYWKCWKCNKVSVDHGYWCALIMAGTHTMCQTLFGIS